jgi:hypothetical protein
MGKAGTEVPGEVEPIRESRRDDTSSHAHSSSRAAKIQKISPALAAEATLSAYKTSFSASASALR